HGAVTLLLRQLGILGNFVLYSSSGLLALYIYFQIPVGALLLYPAFYALKIDAYVASMLLGAISRQYWMKIG
ncbi:ABC transporter permease, partial [Psychromonas arctica]